MLAFHEHHRHFGIGNMIRLDPHIQQPLRKKTEDALVVFIVLRQVDLPLRTIQNIKEPCTVVIQQIPAHDEHIEPVPCRPLHHIVERADILRVTLFQNRPYKIHIFLWCAWAYCE